MSHAAAKIAAILLAGGSGRRMADSAADKTLAEVAGKALLSHSIEAFEQSGILATLIVVYRDAAQRAAIEPLVADCAAEVRFAQGGAERQDSVWSGLQATPDDTEIALIHDGARPLILPEAIRAVAQAARACGAACFASPVSNTIKSVEPRTEGYRLRTLDRSTLWSMETPQAFRFPLIRDAYQRIIDSGRLITDDLSAIEEQDVPVAFIQNPRPNPKLTTPQDLAYLDFLLSRAESIGQI